MSNPNHRLVLSDLYSGSIHELLHPPAGQIPFLDGLRTIAIRLVVNAHLSAKFAETFGSNPFSRRLLDVSQPNAPDRLGCWKALQICDLQDSPRTGKIGQKCAGSVSLPPQTDYCCSRRC